MTILDEDSLRLVFKEARSHGYFLNQRIKSETLYKVYNLAKLAPTAWNTCPMRVVFITSEEAKAKLMEALAPGNRDKTASAPVTAIIAIDMEFYTQLETISPRMANSSYFSELPESDFMQFVFRNANLQAGFFILALGHVD